MNQDNMSFHVTYSENKIQSISQDFFVLFPFFSSTDDFLGSHRCISELFFLEKHSKNYINTQNFDSHWIDNISKSSQNGKIQVIFYSQGKEYHFIVTVFENNKKYSHFLVSFTSINSHIKKEKRLLQSFLSKSQEVKTLQKSLAHKDKLSLMGEMMENITHQWKQPLSSISSSASGIKVQKLLDMLSEEVLSTELDNIIKNIDYLTHTVNDFRNFLSQNKQKRVFQVDDVIQKSLVILGGNLKNKEINISEDIDNKAFCMGYENELMQAIINLLNNAIDELKQIEKTQRAIYITVKKTDHIVKILIEDTAGGVPKKSIKKIFDHYFTTKGEKGSGIGLFMVKQIVHDHFDGKIWVHNTKNGACFTMELPSYDFDGEI